MNYSDEKVSRFLSLVLRHHPERIGIQLDAQGWANVPQLLHGMAAAGIHLSEGELAEIVLKNDKQRFAISRNGRGIRANQGHSVKIDLGYPPQEPPVLLYHGTATRFLDSIRATGLDKRKRHHVHLSASIELARMVGIRHGEVIVMPVRSGAMHAVGVPFYHSANGVWLVDAVPTEYIDWGGLTYATKEPALRSQTNG